MKNEALGTICRENLLARKWLLAPNYRVGNQWLETLVRDGQAFINLYPTTVLRLAIQLVGDELAKDGLTLAGRTVGPLVVDAAWNQLRRDGYLGKLETSAELSAVVFESLLALRLSGCGAESVARSKLENDVKAEDIRVLFRAYEAFLQAHALVDEADILRRALRRLKAEPTALGEDTLVLVPTEMHFTGLERQFVEALPNRRAIPPQRSDASTHPLTFFRAVGEVNEIREVLRCCLAEGQPLDDVELLHTDAETYVPLIYATSRRYFADPERPDGVPVTFAEGLPTTLSRPGRALSLWLRWMQEDFPQRVLSEMLGEGLLNCGDDDELSFGYLLRLFRPIAIGIGADNYLPKLDEQIAACQRTSPQSAPDADDAGPLFDEDAFQRKRKALRSLRKLVDQLLSLSRDRDGIALLDAAEKFLTLHARSVNALDQYSAESLVEQIRDRRYWLDRLNVTLDVEKWLVSLASQTRVMGSGPRPGHLHVANVGAGGHSGRRRTFIVGLDDRRFPGAALQDPILLDRERTRLSPELATSAGRLRQKLDDFDRMLTGRTGTLARPNTNTDGQKCPSYTLSWSCHDLSDDRETFPGSVVLSAYRRISGRHDADLETLNTAVGPPASFAPTTADKSLDESERWLWRLTDESLRGTDQRPLVQSLFPHLARGAAAERQRATGFGPFNGFVPAAGRDLNPFAETKALSASALETAGRCPLAFFFRNGLGLYRPEELEVDPDRWLDAAQFGSLLHEVFRQFLTELTAAGQRPQFERDHQRLAEILKEAVRQWRQNVPPPNESAYRRQYFQLLQTSKVFLEAEEEFCRTSQPRYFEVALGLESESAATPLDEPEPPRIGLPNGQKIRTRGRIDRIDETDPDRFSIWDYKIGSGYGYEQSNPFRQGRRLQSVLYLQMLETVIRKHHARAVVERFGYFFPSVRAHGLRMPWDAKTLRPGLEIVERLCEVIEAGAFLATDKHLVDCTYCDYRSICGDVKTVAARSARLLDEANVFELQPFRELRRE